jgi:hypothetical protein
MLTTRHKHKYPMHQATCTSTLNILSWIVKAPVWLGLCSRVCTPKVALPLPPPDIHPKTFLTEVHVYYMYITCILHVYYMYITCIFLSFVTRLKYEWSKKWCYIKVIFSRTMISKEMSSLSVWFVLSACSIWDKSPRIWCGVQYPWITDPVSWGSSKVCICCVQFVRLKPGFTHSTR